MTICSSYLRWLVGNTGLPDSSKRVAERIAFVYEHGLTNSHVTVPVLGLCSRGASRCREDDLYAQHATMPVGAALAVLGRAYDIAKAKEEAA